MLSKNQIKLICSLRQKKYRDSEQLFVIEGKKMVFELMQSYSHLLKQIVISKDFCSKESADYPIPISVVDNVVFKKISSLVHAQGILAVFSKPELTIHHFDFGLALDNIQDPGNMGTILRLADWFGIQQVICSNDCVDVFNPKVVQASMGSVFRVSIAYENLGGYLKKYTNPIYGAVLNGKNIYASPLKKEGILVVGNEGNGISDEVRPLLTHRLTIPQFGGGESLNVSTATAIMLSEFLRG